jgi:holo-[acyl-carrier protein] synthase
LIVGVGIDLVEVDRVRTLMERHGDRARRRLFTERELADCSERADRAECLAARFAAKEAALKALGIGKVPGVQWTDIETARADSGLPVLALSGDAENHAKRRGVERSWLSLSHEAGLACAVVVLEGGAP